MSDEISLLKELGSASEPASTEVEQHVRSQLLKAMRHEQGHGTPARLRGWRPRVAAALAVAAAAVAAILIVTSGRTPSVADRAYAAISGRVGIMHFIQQYGPRSKPTYEEYWIDLQHPSRQRIVLSSGGTVTRQFVYTGGYSSYFSESGKNHNPLTIITKAPPNPGGGVRAGASPITAYRSLLHAGTVLSQTKTTYNGRSAYRLAIQYTPPYHLTGRVWTGDRVTYTVDSSTYYPLELRYQPDPVMGGSPGVLRYPLFEILPATAHTRQLLRPVRHPSAYHP